MGLEDGSLPSDLISYSSSKVEGNVGRLNGISWNPVKNQRSEYLEILLSFPREVTVIITQGGETGRVTKFFVEYLTGGEEPQWTFITKDGSKKPKVCMNVSKVILATLNSIFYGDFAN